MTWSKGKTSKFELSGSLFLLSDRVLIPTNELSKAPVQQIKHFPKHIKNKSLMKCWTCLATLFGLITFVWQCWTKFDPSQKRILFYVCCLDCWICLTTPTNISPNILLCFHQYVFVNAPQHVADCTGTF